MTDTHNGGTLYSFIEKMKLDLSAYVSRSYREFVYDVVIQLVIGVNAAHGFGLTHGQLDLS
jgi:hypothetical protein